MVWLRAWIRSTYYHHDYHHHHHILLFLQGHRASTKRRHLILFLANCLTSFQLIPSPNTSLWTDLLHVCFGLPLFRCPCGFQSTTSLSMVPCPFLSVCPIQFHFRLPVCTDISLSSALLQSSSFEITSGQWIFKILPRQQDQPAIVEVNVTTVDEAGSVKQLVLI